MTIYRRAFTTSGSITGAGADVVIVSALAGARAVLTAIHIDAGTHNGVLTLKSGSTNLIQVLGDQVVPPRVNLAGPMVAVGGKNEAITFGESGGSSGTCLVSVTGYLEGVV